MIKYITLFVLLFVYTASLSAQSITSTKSTKVYQGFSGGMMIHGGYVFSQDMPSGEQFSVSGFTKGIGGNVKVNLWKHLRVGTEGYVSTIGLKNDGYVRTFWSGLLLEGWSRGKRLSPYGGATVGGGIQKSLYIFSGNSSDWEKEENVVHHKSPFFALAPYTGCEVRISEKFSLNFKLEWLLAFNNRTLLMPTGPRLYVGFLFGH